MISITGKDATLVLITARSKRRKTNQSISAVSKSLIKKPILLLAALFSFLFKESFSNNPQIPLAKGFDPVL